MSIERKRPIKQFTVKVAHGPYRVGDKIQPTGMYRDVLLRRGLIEEVKDAPERREAEPERREAQPEANRMVPQGGTLFTRNKRAR